MFSSLTLLSPLAGAHGESKEATERRSYKHPTPSGHPHDLPPESPHELPFRQLSYPKRNLSRCSGSAWGTCTRAYSSWMHAQDQRLPQKVAGARKSFCPSSVVVATTALLLQDTWPLSMRPGKRAPLQPCFPRPPLTGEVEHVQNQQAIDGVMMQPITLPHERSPRGTHRRPRLATLTLPSLVRSP